MFPSWSQHVQGWTCSRDVLLETSVHWIFDQFQARGFKPTGNHRQFPRADTSAACQWWGMLHMQNCAMEKSCITVHAALDTSWSAWATLHSQTINCSSKTVWWCHDWGIQDSNNTHFQLIFFFPDCYLLSPPTQAPVLRVRQRGMFSFKQRQRKRLPCLPVTPEHKELLCLYGGGSKGSG